VPFAKVTAAEASVRSRADRRAAVASRVTDFAPRAGSVAVLISSVPLVMSSSSKRDARPIPLKKPSSMPGARSRPVLSTKRRTSTSSSTTSRNGLPGTWTPTFSARPVCENDSMPSMSHSLVTEIWYGASAIPSLAPSS